MHMQWQPIETAPSGKAVLIHYKNRLGNSRVIKARYIQRFTEEAVNDDGEGVDDYAFVMVNEGQPTHWMPLPETPEP